MEAEAENAQNITINMPKRREFRQRAHANPSSDRNLLYPSSPKTIFWEDFYSVLKDNPESVGATHPTILDIGCGYGGLMFELSKIYPKELILGLEIRDKVTEYVERKIEELQNNGLHMNVSVQMCNTMRTLMHYIRKNTIKKLFILFPDPHFKKKKENRRIISQQLLDEYGYILQPGGRLYLVTDVRKYYESTIIILRNHPLFNEVIDVSEDPCLEIAKTATEESKKVDENGGSKFSCIFERVSP